MASALADVKQEWRAFVHDEPGKRFVNHRDRMQHKSRSHSAMSLALGVLLLAGGVVLLFIPGPGLLLIVFGLALVATHSSRLSKLLDRTEPRLRRVGRRVARRWSLMSRAAKAAVIGGALLAVAAFLYGTWTWVVSAYVL